MFALLLLLFILVPILEIYVIIQVGQAIGALWTVGLLVLDSILGAALMRSQGRSAWRRFNAALAEGRPPAREVLDGALVIFGGAFLLTPGFVTDVIGAILLLPPTRAVLRSALVRRLTRGMVFRVGGAVAGRAAGRSRRGGGGPAFDVDGTATDVPPGRLP